MSISPGGRFEFSKMIYVVITANKPAANTQSIVKDKQTYRQDQTSISMLMSM